MRRNVCIDVLLNGANGEESKCADSCNRKCFCRAVFVQSRHKKDVSKSVCCVTQGREPMVAEWKMRGFFFLGGGGLVRRHDAILCLLGWWAERNILG